MFGFGILVLCPNSQKRLRLSLLNTLLVVLLRCKDTNITMKVLNFSIGSIIQPLLKTLLAHFGLTGSQRYLILHPDES